MENSAKKQDISKRGANKDVKSLVVKRIARIATWLVGGLAAIVVVAMCIVAWILTPERLTPLVEAIAGESMNATLKADRIELKVWSTFPDLTLDIDNINIVSKSLTKLPGEKRALLPANADSLVSAKHIHAGVNILRILYGTFSLKDISADDLNLNLVAADANNANYLVALPSDEPESTEPTTLPTIFWDKFALRGNTRISYYSAADTIDTKIRLKNASLDNVADDNYHLVLNGSADYAMGGMEYVKNLPLNFDGGIAWNSDHVATVGINDLKASILDIPAKMNMHLAMDNAAMIDLFNLDLGPVKLASVVQILPKVYGDLFSNISSNINATIKAKLTEPYDLAGTDLPSIDATLVVPESYIATANGKARIDRVAMDAAMSINGKKPDKSTITLKQMILGGEAVNLEIKGAVDNFFTDAHVKGSMNGSADIGKVVQVFNLPVNFTVKGDLTADASIDARMSDFTANRFQRMNINGNVNLKDLHYTSVADSIDIYARKADINFGSSDNRQFNGKEITDLLHFTTKIDTLSALMAGMNVTMRNSQLGVGCVGNVADLADSTKIVPLGTRLRSDRISLEQGDGSKVRIRKLDCSGSISRYEGDVRVPKVHLAMGTKRIAYLSKEAAVVLRNGRINMTAHLFKPKNKPGERFRRRVDSLRALHPGWSNDTILQLARAHRGRHARAGEETLDMSVDQSFQKLIRQWRLQGKLSAKSGRLFTPYFPLRNSIKDVDMNFSMDSVIFKNVTYRVGQSQIDLKGGIRNIRTALLGRNRKPLSIIFLVKADTLNINQLIKAATDGMAYANTAEAGTNVFADAESEAAVQHITENAVAEGDTVLAAFVVPGNIDAKIALRAKNVIYSDLYFNRFYGDMLMRDGVLNLRELRANTDIGSARFNALYAAPDRNDIKFGFDLGLKDIQIGKFIGMIPAVDSIMPLLESVDGVIDADLAATTNVDSTMNIVIPSLKAAMKLHGKDLVFMDAATFKKIAKMLLFKNKERNVIDEMTVELLVEDSQMELFPFMFDVDRYRLGVLGHNDLDMNFRYHISVLKSPIPFKFGINIYGNPDKMHFRFGGAKYKDNMAREQVKIVDTTRINLREQINQAFHRGAKAALKSGLNFGNRPKVDSDLKMDDANFSHEDSLMMIEGGFFPAPPAPPVQPTTAPAETEKGKKKSTKANQKQNAVRKEN